MVIIKKNFINRYSKIIRIGNAIGLFPLSFKPIKIDENDENDEDNFCELQLKCRTFKYVYRYFT